MSLTVVDCRMLRRKILPLALILIACGEPVGPDVLMLTLDPEVGLVVGVGGTFRFTAEPQGVGGDILAVDGVTWTSADPGVASVDGEGRVTGAAVGVTMISAELRGVSGTAQVEVYEPASVSVYEPGVSYFGRGGYVEYIPGTLPVVLSAPHGGALRPGEIPDRSFGIVDSDRNTRELTMAVRDAWIDETGAAPHVVISHLHRSKLDPNREIEEAAQGSPFAEYAWTEYHEWIARARTAIASRGEGMYFDVHGHGHPVDRVELGYLISADRLNGSDASLDGIPTIQLSSIRELGRDSGIPFSQLLRGPTSLGGFLEDEGVPSVPSPSDPSPGADPYFSGGYSTRRHGSIGDGEVVSGVQLEHHFPGLRDTDENRRAYAVDLATAVRLFMLEHIGFFEPVPFD